jgi:hypothetical protein
MKYSSRFFLYAPLTLFLCLAAWAMGYWWVVAGALDKKLDRLNGHEAFPGVTMSYASKTISGFPFNIDVVFTGLKFFGGGAHGPVAWSTERFALHRLTYGRAQDIYEAAGHQSVSWTDKNGRAHAFRFLPGSLHASAITDARGLARFDLDMIAMDGTDTDGAPFTAGRLQFHLRRDPKGNALDLMARADSVNGRNIQIKNLRSYSTLTNAGALASLLAGTQSWPDADAAWEKSGGVGQPDAQGASLAPLLNALY